jgi:hypothetical protein
VKSVKVQLVRDGSSRGVLEEGRAYIFIGPSGIAEQFLMPIGHEDCLKLLHALRYGPKNESEPSAQQALNQLAGSVTQILKSKSAPLPFDEPPLHLLPFASAGTTAPTGSVTRDD